MTLLYPNHMNNGQVAQRVLNSTELLWARVCYNILITHEKLKKYSYMKCGQVLCYLDNVNSYAMWSYRLCTLITLH